MSISDILLLAAVGAALYFALRAALRRRKKGCCGNCQRCAGCARCYGSGVGVDKAGAASDTRRDVGSK